MLPPSMVLWVSYPRSVRLLRRACGTFDRWVSKLEARTAVYVNNRGQRVEWRG